eukprot:39139_1
MALFSFGGVDIGSDATGSWRDARTLDITVGSTIPAVSSRPVIGATRVTVSGTLQALGGSDNSNSQSSPLSGSFGTPAPTDFSGQLIIPNALTVAEDSSATSLSGYIHINSSIAARSISLVISATAGVFPTHGGVSTVTLGVALASELDAILGGNLSYSPNLNFNGPDAITVELLVNGTVKNVNRLLVTVTAVEDAPTIVLNSNASIALGQSGVFMNVTVGDIDSSVIAALLSCSQGQFVFPSSAQAGVEYDPVFESGGLSPGWVKLVGSAANLNLGLAQMKYVSVAGVASASEDDREIVNVEIDDRD